MTFRGAIACSLLTATALAGCTRDDPRLASLEPGLARDSVVTLMGRAADRPYAFLVRGVYIEVMSFRREGIEGPAGDLTRAQLTPLVFLNGQLAGWGWDYTDSVSAANQLTIEPGE